MTKLQMKKDAKARVRKLTFGEQITNVCAGEKNPHRLCYFVRNLGGYVECTNGEKEFWKTGCEVIYAGHLKYSECEEIFKQIHKILYS